MTKESRKRLVSLLFAVVLMVGIAPHLNAQQAAPNPLKVTVENLTAAHDSVRARVESPAALPNDTLRYVLTFTNREQRPLRNIVFDNPIPAGMTLVGGTARGSTEVRVEFSIDGGRQYSTQPMVLVQENGQQVRRPASTGSYTHIRWTLTGTIAPGASVTAQYDARVTGR